MEFPREGASVYRCYNGTIYRGRGVNLNVHVHECICLVDTRCVLDDPSHHGTRKQKPGNTQEELRSITVYLYHVVIVLVPTVVVVVIIIFNNLWRWASARLRLLMRRGNAGPTGTHRPG
jgi:hypothetical protein